jgi:hypothetical protein
MSGPQSKMLAVVLERGGCKEGFQPCRLRQWLYHVVAGSVEAVSFSRNTLKVLDI